MVIRSHIKSRRSFISQILLTARQHNAGQKSTAQTDRLRALTLGKLEFKTDVLYGVFYELQQAQ